MTVDAGRVPFLGLGVDAVGMEEALSRVEGFLAANGPHQVITANPLMLLAAEKDTSLAAAFREAALVIPDGAGLSISAALRGRALPRVPGIELMENLCALAARRKWRVYLLGAAPGVARAAADALCAKNPGLCVVGAEHGYFQGKEEEAVSRVAAARPDLLFVALATPFQDGWIHKNLRRFKTKVAMGVGGSFDVFSGRLRRAPAGIQCMGLEWLFRLAQEPSRWRRMTGLPVFLFRSLFSPQG